ncbi:DoxX family membrane protein [Cellulomonas shaoxiangyii]|uniref:DoxX family membrane protein n=1 Tax=Cellulomonas shaoxiangyii TaxID=2566013 RepID=A0A4P7SK15_9CELL|nr:DoxX family membrane protein [Cellulomonas shaoxiangyii]QCB94181.1 DoxX family membrane protein [Cellulomonas shaoxiangyii]TGY86674.1 DoxX family membrane protein [Cellulomonas shaoxiangyii]
MLLRRAARPMFATWFVSQGLDALRHPQGHARIVRDALDGVRSRVPDQARAALPGPVGAAVEGRLTDPQLATAARVHGAALLVAGAALAVGRAPRTAALALAGLTLPIVLVNLPLGRKRSEEEERERTARLVRAVGFTGGALIAGVDLEGRPGVGWRVQHARADRAAMRQARARWAAKHADA